MASIAPGTTGAAPAAAVPVTRGGFAKLALALGALGVVFGDIGTSPLYAFTQCFRGVVQFPATPQNVLGIISLVIWALVLVVCVKYIGFVLRADHQGEGGTLALLALLRPTSRVGIPPNSTVVVLLILFGSAMLYGDGVITPAISVLSALEGVGVFAPAAARFEAPATIVILILLFALQARGTEKIGRLFGPIMLVWFAALAVSGIVPVLDHPQVLAALSPSYALAFFFAHGYAGFLVLGAVVLCVTGVEALYADLGHFGAGPIRLAWFALVFPALAVNYLGQAARALADPQHALDAGFYGLFPAWLVLPMTILSTLATVIASQALITGAFSLTQQAVQLGYLPRLQIVHTSSQLVGQIYMPFVNAALAVACIALVAIFRTSDHLAAAYGLAVTVTMTTTSIAFAVFLRTKWKWRIWQIALIEALFLSFDLSFLLAGLDKFLVGGWIPFVIAGVLFACFTTWIDGRRKMSVALSAETIPVEEFIDEVKRKPVARVGGTAVFMTPNPEGIPFALHHEWLRTHILSEQIVLLTIVNDRIPWVDDRTRIEAQPITPHLTRIKAHYGFMEQPTIQNMLKPRKGVVNPATPENATFILARPKFEADSPGQTMPKWRRLLYRFLANNSSPMTDSLGIRPDHTIEVGIAVKI